MSEPGSAAFLAEVERAELGELLALGDALLRTGPALEGAAVEAAHRAWVARASALVDPDERAQLGEIGRRSAAPLDRLAQQLAVVETAVPSGAERSDPRSAPVQTVARLLRNLPDAVAFAGLGSVVPTDFERLVLFLLRAQFSGLERKELRSGRWMALERSTNLAVTVDVLRKDGEETSILAALLEDLASLTVDSGVRDAFFVVLDPVGRWRDPARLEALRTEVFYGDRSLRTHPVLVGGLKHL